MKYPLTVGAVALLVLYVLGSAVYKVVNDEQCPVAVEYTLPKSDALSTTRLKKDTEHFAQGLGYRFMDSSLEGTLTLYAPADNDRMIVNVNDTKAQVIGVSFYDCRKGGNGSATGFAWLRDIGSRYL